jgi:hypothetical protein
MATPGFKSHRPKQFSSISGCLVPLLASSPEYTWQSTYRLSQTCDLCILLPMCDVERRAHLTLVHHAHLARSLETNIPFPVESLPAQTTTTTTWSGSEQLLTKRSNHIPHLTMYREDSTLVQRASKPFKLEPTLPCQDDLGTQ